MANFFQLSLFDEWEGPESKRSFEWLLGKPAGAAHSMGAKQAGNLFLGFMPEDEAQKRTVAESARLDAGLHIGGHFVRKDCLHISAFGLGRHPGPFVTSALGTHIESAVQLLHLKPFKVTFDRTACFNGQRGQCAYVFLPSEGEEGLKLVNRVIGGELARRLELPYRTSYRPHMTVLYSTKRPPEVKIQPVTCVARELVLIYSHVGEGRYTILGRWPLAE